MKKGDNILKVLTIGLLIGIGGLHAEGQERAVGMRIQGGLSVGGTTPTSMPATITSIDKYRIVVGPMVGIGIDIPMATRWSIEAGLRLENKGMDTEVSSEGYHMEIVKGKNRLSGYFTGRVKQEVELWMMSVPVQVCYQANSKLRIRAGLWGSKMIRKRFEGIAYDGYLRVGVPTGPRIMMGDTEEDWATYDFSEDLKGVSWGVMIGVDYEPWRRVGFEGELSCGMTSIFPSDFTTVVQKLYPVYGMLGVYYRVF